MVNRAPLKCCPDLTEPPKAWPAPSGACLQIPLDPSQDSRSLPLLRSVRIREQSFKTQLPARPGAIWKVAECLPRGTCHLCYFGRESCGQWELITSPGLREGQGRGPGQDRGDGAGTCW